MGQERHDAEQASENGPYPEGPVKWTGGGKMSELTIDYFGGCPTCGRNDRYVNAGSTHVFYCLEHRVSWIFGANIFSGWREETEAEQREKYKLIESFERVEPLWPENAHVVFGPPA
jgi:hypothetical protein